MQDSCGLFFGKNRFVGQGLSAPAEDVLWLLLAHCIANVNGLVASSVGFWFSCVASPHRQALWLGFAKRARRDQGSNGLSRPLSARCKLARALCRDTRCDRRRHDRREPGLRATAPKPPPATKISGRRPKTCSHSQPLCRSSARPPCTPGLAVLPNKPNFPNKKPLYMCQCGRTDFKLHLVQPQPEDGGHARCLGAGHFLLASAEWRKGARPAPTGSCPDARSSTARRPGRQPA